MKKSKIIVPALGILLLSTAASVSGTVAWFTASRTFETKVSQFAVGSVDGSLSATVAAGLGTTVVEATTDTIQFKADGAAQADTLTDASYDHVNDKLYTDNAGTSEAASGVNESDFHLVGTDGTRTVANYKVSATATNYNWYAVTWTINLNYEFGGDDHDVHLFFDAGASALAETGAVVVDGTGSNHVTSGMRFALRAPDTTKVWAPQQAEANCKYANSATSVGTYTDSVLIASDFATGNSTISSASAYAKATDNMTKTAASARADYMGTLKYSAATGTPRTGTLAITVVAWLEGTDPNVLSTNDIYNMTAHLNFYATTSSEITA